MPDGIRSVCPCRPAVEGAPERASWAGSASRAPSWPNGTQWWRRAQLRVARGRWPPCWQRAPYEIRLISAPAAAR